MAKIKGMQGCRCMPVMQAVALIALAHMQEDFRGVRCVDAGAFNWYPKHHRPVKLRHDDSEGAKGAIADQEGHKDHKGFQFKVFSLCYVTSFDEVSTAVKMHVEEGIGVPLVLYWPPITPCNAQGWMYGKHKVTAQLSHSTISFGTG